MAKGICMFFVIVSHTGYVDVWLGSFFRPFFLSTFFFVSGLFFINAKVRERRCLSKAADLFFSLVLPYVVYWAISFAVEQLLLHNYLFFDDLALGIIGGRKLWFVSALIVAEYCALMWFALVRPNRVTVVILMVLCLLIHFIIPKGNYPWFVDAAPLACFYLTLGMLIRTYFEKYLALLSNDKVGIVAAVIFIGMVVADSLFEINRGAFHESFTCYPFFFLESFVSIHVCLYTCTKIRTAWLKRCLMFMGLYSLLYYFFQNQALHITKRLGTILLIDSPNALYALLSALIVAVVLIIPIVIVNRYIPVMTGKWRPYKAQN